MQNQPEAENLNAVIKRALLDNWPALLGIPGEQSLLGFYEGIFNGTSQNSFLLSLKNQVGCSKKLEKEEIVHFLIDHLNDLGLEVDLTESVQVNAEKLIIDQKLIVEITVSNSGGFVAITIDERQPFDD